MRIINKKKLHKKLLNSQNEETILETLQEQNKNLLKKHNKLVEIQKKQLEKQSNKELQEYFFILMNNYYSAKITEQKDVKPFDDAINLFMKSPIYNEHKRNFIKRKLPEYEYIDKFYNKIRKCNNEMKEAQNSDSDQSYDKEYLLSNINDLNERMDCIERKIKDYQKSNGMRYSYTQNLNMFFGDNFSLY